MPSIVTNLWFDGQAEEAARFYTELFGGTVGRALPYGPDQPGVEGTTMTVDFEILGMKLTGINGGPQFPFTEAVSLEVQCETQQELDRIWFALVDGGKPGPCGWCKDRYGLSWQITPNLLGALLEDGDPDGINRAMKVVLSTDGQPLNFAAIRAAYDRE
ncbi:VOC family protein [Nakamurella lactea]|uniref:VOC family protein n=1 Tax=Nakamurella lactea TaxID=459515 RepID=UPI0003F68B46|nr:VOC family protein [Nakamurella lactea]